jgi:hypothetical protein
MKIPATKSVAVTATFYNENGYAVKPQGEISWESSDPNIAKVEANPTDTKQAVITAGPSAGEAEIFATADGDLGDGVREVEAVTQIVVVARGEAIGGEITVVRPEHGLPGSGSGNHIDNALPGQPGHIDNSLPGHGEHPSNGLPSRPGGVHRPDNSLPGQGHVSGQPTPPQPGPDQGLPPGGHVGNKPGHDLPDHAQPKK